MGALVPVRKGGVVYIIYSRNSSSKALNLYEASLANSHYVSAIMVEHHRLLSGLDRYAQIRHADAYENDIKH